VQSANGDFRLCHREYPASPLLPDACYFWPEAGAQEVHALDLTIPDVTVDLLLADIPLVLMRP